MVGLGYVTISGTTTSAVVLNNTTSTGYYPYPVGGYNGNILMPYSYNVSNLNPKYVYYESTISQ